MRRCEIEDFLEGFNQPTYRGVGDKLAVSGEVNRSIG
jgi:hypothetical protein